MDEVRNRAGDVVDFSYDDDVANLFLEMVTDKVARSFLFGTDAEYDSVADDVNLTGYEIIKVMKRIINAAFVVSFCRWKQIYDETANWKWKSDVDYYRNSRFTKIFQSAIGNEDITIDLEIFALIELWVSLKDVHTPTFVRDQFAKIFDPGFTENGDAVGLTLQSARDAIKNASFKTGEHGIYTKEYCNVLCYRLLDSFLIFKDAKFGYPADNRLDDDKDFSIVYQLFGREITLYPNAIYDGGKLVVTHQQLLKMQGKQNVNPPAVLLLYMFSEISAFGGKKQITYRAFDGEGEARINVEENTEKQKKHTLVDNLSDLKEMRKFLSFNYKNIRELAVVISDAIKNNPAKRQELFSLCEAKYDKIVADIPSYDAPNIYWDNIITLMLVEMGFSDFLELVIKDEQIFLAVMHNIEWRCIGRMEAYNYLEEYQRRKDELEKACKNNLTSYEAARVDLCVRMVLKAMKFDRDEGGKFNAFEESLTFKYENILLCLDVLRRREEVPANEWDESRERLIDIYRNIFVFLQIFYNGLDRYAEKRMQLSDKSVPSDGETEDEARRRIMNQHRQCFDAFTEKAQEKYDEIKYQSLSEVFDGFCELCNKYNSSATNDSFSISPEAKRLKYLITRNYICDVEKLRYFVTIQLQSGERSTIFKMLESPSSKYFRDPKYYEWLDYFHDIFFFLIYNEDYNERDLWNETKVREKKDRDWTLKDKNCDPIYPYIVTYYKENIDRDNLKKCTYKVPMPTGGSKENNRNGFVVTLLTEENYPPNTYYCIPLRYGSSESWWINPFLIPKFVMKRLKLEEKNESHND